MPASQPGDCKGVSDRVPAVNTSGSADPQLCPNGECRDEILLKGLDGRIAQLPAAQRPKASCS